MKILIVSMFPLQGAGSGTYCRIIARQQLSEGNEVCMLLPASQSRESVPGVCTFFIDPCEGRPFPVFTAHPESTRVFNDLSDRELAHYISTYELAIREIIDRQAIDKIHFQHLWCIAALAKHYRIPSVVTCHGTDIMGCRKWPRFRKYFFQSIEACDEVIVVSRSQARQLLSLCPGLQNKLTVRYNSVDASVFHKKEMDRSAVLRRFGCGNAPENIFLFAGKMTTVKGIDVLLDAVLLLQREEPTGKLPLFIVAGFGELSGYAKDFCQRNGLKNVLFTGFVNQEELCDLMNISTALLMPSRYEPFGYIAAEAMACGLFVIASAVDGLGEIVTEDRGVLVKPGDPGDLADAIRKRTVPFSP